MMPRCTSNQSVAKKSMLAITLLTSISVMANTYDSHNVESSDLLTGVYSITVDQTGMTPVIRVKSDGEKYTAVQPGQSIVWKANTRGVCRSLRKIREYRWWLNDNTQANPHAYYSHHKQVAKKDWITSKHSDDKYTANGDLSTPVSAKLANAAIKACNDYLQAEKGKGKSPQSILSEDKTLYSQDNDKPLLAGVVYMQCNADSGMDTMLGHAWQNIRINYVCEGFDAPKPGGGSSANVGKIAAPFVLEEPKINVTPAEYNGNCPVDVQVEGTLKANQGQTEVQYRWAHNGALGPVATTKLNTSGWKTVNTVIANVGANQSDNPGDKIATPKPTKNKLQIKAQADNLQTGYVELKALPLGENNWDKAKTSAKGTYKINCKQPIIAGNAKLALPSDSDPQELKPDLTPGVNITVGNITGQWGGVINVDASIMSGRQRGDRCELRVVYDVKNIGQGNADKFVSKLFEDNDSLLQSTTQQLASGQQTKNSGVIYLANGSHLIGVSIDDQGQISESDEGNNKNRITVNVSYCGGESSGRAERNQHSPNTNRGSSETTESTGVGKPQRSLR